jgi:hypothetical protein
MYTAADTGATIPAMAAAAVSASTSRDNFGLAWVLLCLAFCTHVVDEAFTRFLGVYNSTVTAIRANLSWFPMPTFEYSGWLIGLIFANVVLLALTPLAYRNVRALRPLAYFYATIMLLNGMGHTIFTVLGRTVASVTFPRPAPGFYSSPFLLITPTYLFLRLSASRQTIGE